MPEKRKRHSHDRTAGLYPDNKERHLFLSAIADTIALASHIGRSCPKRETGSSGWGKCCEIRTIMFDAGSQFEVLLHNTSAALDKSDYRFIYHYHCSFDDITASNYRTTDNMNKS